MLHRNEGDKLTVITQPAHAWVSGQLARHWADPTWLEPAEEVFLAAEQHDMGFLEWERNPDLNPETGLPYSFLEMPHHLHLEIWEAGIQKMLRFGRYPALLVSMHFTNIARQNWIGNGKEEDIVNAYLQEQEALQATLTTSLINDYFYGAITNEQRIRKQQQLVSVWDWISLLTCLKANVFKNIPEVPWEAGTRALSILPGETERSYTVDPWPFTGQELTVTCEGRHLLRKYESQDEMRQALRAAAPVTLRFHLTPLKAN